MGVQENYLEQCVIELMHVARKIERHHPGKVEDIARLIRQGKNDQEILELWNKNQVRSDSTAKARESMANAWRDG